MDEPGLDPELHRAPLVGLRLVNAISRTSSHIWRAITSQLTKPVDHPLVIGDLACGGGDIVIELAQLAHQDGWPVRAIGDDLSEQALRFARKRAEETALDISFESRDLLGAELPAGIDVFYSSRFMHHLSSGAADARPTDGTDVARVDRHDPAVLRGHRRPTDGRGGLGGLRAGRAGGVFGAIA